MMNKKTTAIPSYILIAAACGAVLRVLYSIFSFYDPEEYSYIIAVKTNDIHRFIGMIEEFRAGCLDLFFLKFLYTISHNELFIRLSFVALGIVFVIVVYRLVLAMSGSLFIGSAVAMMVAFSPLHIYYAQIIRYHNFVCIFSALSLYSFYILLTDKPGWKQYVIYGLSTALAMMSHYYVVYLIAAQGGAFLLMRGRSLEKWKTYVISQIFTLLFFLPWLPMFMFHMNSRSVGSGFGVGSIVDQFRGTGILNIADAVVGFFISDTWNFHDDFLLYKLILIVTLLFLLVVGLLAVLRYFKERSDLVLYAGVVFVVTTILPFATLQLTCAVFTPKYLLPFTIMFYTIVAYGMEKAAGWLRAALVVAVVFVFAGSFYVIMDAATDKPTIKSIVPEIVKQIDKDTALVTTIYVCGENIRDYAGIFGKDLDIIIAARIPEGRAGYMLNEPANKEDLEKVINAIEGYENLWIFYCVLGYEETIGDSPESDDDEGENIFAEISSVMELKETVQFKISPRKHYFVGRAYRFQRKP